MKPSLDKLSKFFRLEAERGYDNRAVVGGLDRMLDRWEAEARSENIADDLIQLVNQRLRSYPSLTPASRAETLEGIWKRIQRISNENLPPLPSFEPGVEIPDQDVKSGAESFRKEKEKDINPPTVVKSGKSPRSVRRPPLAAEGQPAALDAPTTVLQGVGPKHGLTLARLGIHTLGDLLYYFPRRYIDYSQLKPINQIWYGEEITIIGMVDNIVARIIRSGRMQIVEAVISDGSGSIRVTWFNQPWLAKRISKGAIVSLSGKVDQYLGRLVMNNPEIEQIDKENLSTNRIVPVYSLTAKITQRWLRTMMYQVVSYWAPRVQDPLPQEIQESAGLLDLTTALLQIHYPDSWEQLQAARYRLAFDEIFMIQLGVLQQKRAWQDRLARVYPVDAEWLENQINGLPFSLTNAQSKAIQDVCTDLASGHPMNRLLQGDVGSGKTVVAAMAIAVMAHHGVQSALMAPTSILAEQHYRNLLLLLTQSTSLEDPPNLAVLKPEEICLLIGATPESEKDRIRDGLSAGSIKLVIGTHALIEEPVTFNNLQLAIIDEQHRFGVQQRAALRTKGDNPHLLVMTATPIPRSLALTIYGDLDLSILDEMPPGRQAVETQVFLPRERERAYALVKSQVSTGRQAFIIYPLVEETENSEAKAAVEEYSKLQKEIFPDLRIGLLHGRLNPDDKDSVMHRFRECELDILVSTSVVEVGVDVPNATVMMIEGANRFGLAQLHQFRGRVGRGQDKSYCILIPDTPDAIENERLAAMIETNDGFILAERDLEQRGAGEFLGTRQSGYRTELRLASLTDIHLIDQARREALNLFDQDPELQMPEHQMMSNALVNFWGDGRGDIS
jgi:ATP-dependent DNA helicase RecG